MKHHNQSQWHLTQFSKIAYDITTSLHPITTTPSGNHSEALAEHLVILSSGVSISITATFFNQQIRKNRPKFS